MILKGLLTSKVLRVVSKSVVFVRIPIILEEIFISCLKCNIPLICFKFFSTIGAGTLVGDPSFPTVLTVTTIASSIVVSKGLMNWCDLAEANGTVRQLRS